MIAEKDNKTLKITAGKEYEVYLVNIDISLVTVCNDVGDKVVMTKYEFKEK